MSITDANRQDNAQEPTLAEKARSLTEQGGHSSLSSMSRKHSGYPFGSIMPYGLTQHGEPTFLISSMAMHTRNLLECPRATLLVSQQSPSGNTLGAGRISLLGDVLPIENADEGTQSNYVSRNPQAQNWLHFGDFTFFKMTIRDVYFVGGFGVMGWVRPKEYLAAQPDPLASCASDVIEHMNSDHREALSLIVQQLHGVRISDAEMTSLDRLGFNVRVVSPEGQKGIRIAFPNPIESPQDVRGAFVQMAHAARGE